MALVVGEFGKIHRFGVGYDMSSNTSISVTYNRPSSADLTKTAALGTTQATVTLTNGESATFNANEYAEVTFADGDIPAADAGVWTAQLTYVDATKTLKSEQVSFDVVVG